MAFRGTGIFRVKLAGPIPDALLLHKQSVSLDIVILGILKGTAVP